MSAAVSAGAARVGLHPGPADGEERWTYGVEGEPVERARGLARERRGPGVLVTDEVAVGRRRPLRAASRWAMGHTASSGRAGDAVEGDRRRGRTGD